MFYFIWVWEEIYVRTSVHAYIHGLSRHFDLLKRVLIALIRNFLKYDFRSIFLSPLIYIFCQYFYVLQSVKISVADIHI
jgi:hypothetical protein